MAKTPQIKLAVLETAEWYREDRIATSRPLFQLLTQLVYSNPNWFHFATFTGPDSFKETLNHLVEKHGVQYIYIGTHGKEGKIQFPTPIEEGGIDIRAFDCFDKTTLKGVLFGSCQLASLAENISRRLKEKTMEKKGRQQMSPWFAGYTESVDWMDGAWLDMAFLRLVLGFQKHDDDGENPSYQLKVNSQGDMGIALSILDGEGYQAMREKWGFSVYMNGKKIEAAEDET